MKKNIRIIHDKVLDFCNDDIAFANKLIKESLLLQYLEKKTKAIDKDSKSRFSFANLYAIYVVTENYISITSANLDYTTYDGMIYSAALERTRSLPFGSKLQNHALNHRCNQEFEKFFPKQPLAPIVRDLITKRYWIETKLLLLPYKGEIVDISSLIINIIDAYVKEVSNKFEGLLQEILDLSKDFKKTNDGLLVTDFLLAQLQPAVDARTFELVSFVILKYFYQTQTLYFGTNPSSINKTNLALFKTGRTNANDGGIDYILQPLGRIYQVTEDLNFKKYFLDIEKINHYPITFVIKTPLSKKVVYNKIAEEAFANYPTESAVKTYLDCFEDIITINELKEYLNVIIYNNLIPELLDELLKQTIFEFNVTIQQ